MYVAITRALAVLRIVAARGTILRDSHAGDTMTADRKTPDFSAHSEFSVRTA
jgi:hypothetical protein